MSHKLTTALAPHNTALYCEDETEVARLVSDFKAEHNPVGPTETYLVEQMARAVWNTRRHGRTELGLLDLQTSRAADRMDRPRVQDRDRTDPEIHSNNTLLLGAAFHEDCDKDRRAQERIARLRDAAERSFLRCLKALRQEQDRRRKALVQPRPAIEAGAPVQAAAHGSDGNSNVVVLRPAAKAHATAAKPSSTHASARTNAAPLKPKSAKSSDFSGSLPPAG